MVVRWKGVKAAVRRSEPTIGETPHGALEIDEYAIERFDLMKLIADADRFKSCRSFFLAREVMRRPKSVQLIIFSYDRPLQLEGLLTSLHENLSGDYAVDVIYRASSRVREKHYLRVFQEHRHRFVRLIREYGGASFLFQLMRVLVFSKAGLIGFFVDDDILIKTVSVDDIVAAHPGWRGVVTLRLGENITGSMFAGITTELPGSLNLKSSTSSNYCDDLLDWDFGDGGNNWKYLGIDGTFFSRPTLLRAISFRRCTNPNFFENALNRPRVLKKISKGVAFRESRVVNIPANRVQNSHPNPINSAGSPIQELESLFEAGYRIEVEKYYGQTYPRLHMDIPILVVPREGRGEA